MAHTVGRGRVGGSRRAFPCIPGGWWGGTPDVFLWFGQGVGTGVCLLWGKGGDLSGFGGERWVECR